MNHKPINKRQYFMNEEDDDMDYGHGRMNTNMFLSGRKPRTVEESKLLHLDLQHQQSLLQQAVQTNKKNANTKFAKKKQQVSDGW